MVAIAAIVRWRAVGLLGAPIGPLGRNERPAAIRQDRQNEKDAAPPDAGDRGQRLAFEGVALAGDRHRIRDITTMGSLWLFSFGEHSPCRAFEVGIAPDRGSARAASDQDVAGLSRGRNRRSRTADTHDRRRARPAARAPAGGRPPHPCWRILYMRRFVLGWQMFGLERSSSARAS